MEVRSSMRQESPMDTTVHNNSSVPSGSLGLGSSVCSLRDSSALTEDVGLSPNLSVMQVFNSKYF